MRIFFLWSVWQDICTGTFSQESQRKPPTNQTELLQSVCENICSKIWSCVTRKSAHWHKNTKSNQISVQPHVCEICQKHFSQIDQLKTHKRVHTGVKPHKCPQCDKCFSQTGTLMRHKLSHAREDGEFACNLCVKTFTEALTLRSHQRMHSGEKPCICNICEKSFTNSASLTNHKRMHTGACKLCKKSFTQSIDLKDHQSVHGSRYLW